MKWTKTEREYWQHDYRTAGYHIEEQHQAFGTAYICYRVTNDHEVYMTRKSSLAAAKRFCAEHRKATAA